LGAILTLLLGQSVSWISLPYGFELIGLIAITFMYTFFYGAGTNEEPGWRGFALPRLQSKFSPLIASIILGLIWGFWHTPIYLPQYSSLIQYGIFLLNTIKIAIILTWLYNRTGGSVLAAALLHTIGNITFEFLPSTLASELIQLGVMIVLILTDRMWKKKKELKSD
ncbi:MAG: CPBP family intramembrane metalloprotease, partial [Candidatus Lokiarchaeota archaeon]|nr:CPBP family intramembrane metalloprotease [Candidatus Lokiarchaeota archaeon]